MRSIAILATTLMMGCTFHLSAQLLPTQYDTLPRSQEVTLTAVGEYSSTSLENQLTRSFFRGGLITEDIKISSFDRHKGINRFGGIAQAEIEYDNYNVLLFKKYGMVVKAGYTTVGGMVYSDDFFGLGMFGNERYVGDTIDLGGFDINLTTFQKVGFGGIHPKSKSSVVLNVYNIQNRYSGFMRSGFIGQDADGDTVTVGVDGKFEGPQRAQFSQGLGFGVDLDFKLGVAWGKEETAYIQFQAKNIGVGYNFAPQTVYSADTTFQYTGFQFNQIVGDNAIALDSVDVLDTLGVSKSTRTGAFMLPGMIQVGKIVDRHSAKRVQSFFGVRMYPTLAYIPYVYAGAHVKTNDWLSFGANVGYGGFTNIRGGLYANMEWEKLSVGLSTEDIVGVVYRKGLGKSLYFRIRCAF